MASNKMSSKTKMKEVKTAKAASKSTEGDVDLSMLRKPVSNNVTTFGQARRIFDLASEECKNLISNECDLLYECKVCRNIFRSLINFITHKRIYCNEKFNPANHGHFVRPMTLGTEISKLKQLERKLAEISIDPDARIPMTKDLTTIIEEINKKRGVPNSKQREVQQVVLQKISTSNSAVFQSVHEEGQIDSMKAQVNEIDLLESQDRGVLQGDGTFVVQSSNIPIETEPESVIQISDDEDEHMTQSLICKICNLQFSTVKTLKFHVKYKHLENRLVYPCPDCIDIFSTSWSVYRHLFKVHRKSAAQIRRLRESIQAKAFKMNNPPAYYEKRKNNMKAANLLKIAEKEKLEHENQAWMESMEGDSEVPRCGGCGRMFERRAALAAHTHTCVPRGRALARRADHRRIEIQIRKDYNKTPASIPSTNIETHGKINEDSIDDESSMDVDESGPEKTVTSSQSLLRSNVFEDKEAKEQAPVPDVCEILDDEPQFETVEQKNIDALKIKIAPDVDLGLLKCKLCDNISVNMIDLLAHMAEHYKWKRFACKMCDYKNYSRDMLSDHIINVHQLAGTPDFYASTIKVLEPTEAVEISTPSLSRRVSSESRPSDDSTTKSELTTNRKRKLTQPQSRKKKDKEEDASSDLVSSRSEENSSDMDDIEDKLNRKILADEELLSVISSRRPVRKRSKPKNDDFEYDLSNLLKMEAQGYKDSQQLLNAKINQNKKKVHSEPVSPVNEVTNSYSGALSMLSKEAVRNGCAAARLFNIFNTYSPKKIERPMFVKPPIPKLQVDPEKISPNKAINVDNIENINEENTDISNGKNKRKEDAYAICSIDNNHVSPTKDSKVDENSSENSTSPKLNKDVSSTDIGSREQITPLTHTISSNKTLSEPIKKQLPIKVPRKSLEIIKAPMVGKKLSGFSKGGIIPKVLVIKPINRNKDNGDEQIIKKPMKFQTIKLKDVKDGTINKFVKITSKVKVNVEDKQNETLDSNSVNSTNTVNVETNCNNSSAISNDTSAVPVPAYNNEAENGISDNDGCN